MWIIKRKMWVSSEDQDRRGILELEKKTKKYALLHIYERLSTILPDLSTHLDNKAYLYDLTDMCIVLKTYPQPL
jgi:hypothetical protein